MSARCNSEECALLKNIKRQFISSVDLKYFDWQDLFQHIYDLEFDDCMSHHDKFLDYTIKNLLIIRRPLKKQYQVAFLRYYIDQVERFNIESAEIYEAYLELIDKFFDDKAYYKHYFLGEEVISVLENSCVISSGTTGLHTWEAGIALANWCLAHKEVISDKQVAELGSGSGLTGLVIINSSHPPSRYAFSDCHSLVLQQLSTNLKIHIPGVSWPRHFREKTFVDLWQFDWEDLSPQSFGRFETADVILAADCVFDNKLTEALCAVIEKFVSLPEKSAVIACTVRNQETIDFFVDNIKNKGLNIIEDSSEYSDTIQRIPISPVKIYLINKVSGVSEKP